MLHDYILCSISELTEIRSCVKVEVDVPPGSRHSFCGRKATLNIWEILFSNVLALTVVRAGWTTNGFIPG